MTSQFAVTAIGVIKWQNFGDRLNTCCLDSLSSAIPVFATYLLIFLQLLTSDGRFAREENDSIQCQIWFDLVQPISSFFARVGRLRYC